MINNKIVISDSQIGAYIEKSIGKVRVGKKELQRENEVLRKRIAELEVEIQRLREKK